MLSRTADHLYWMARYIERAENLARMLEVNYRMSLLPHDPQSGRAGLGRDADDHRPAGCIPAALRGLHASERDRVHGVRPRQPGEHLQLPARGARERARRARHADLGDLGDAELHLARDARRRRALPRDARSRNFFEWVKDRSHLARGVVQGTMLRDEAWHFIWLGTLPRARRQHVAHPRREVPRAAAAWRDRPAAPRITTNGARCCARCRRSRSIAASIATCITPLRVAELLVLRDDMPRSLRSCV